DESCGAIKFSAFALAGTSPMRRFCWARWGSTSRRLPAPTLPMNIVEANARKAIPDMTMWSQLFRFCIRTSPNSHVVHQYDYETESGFGFRTKPGSVLQIRPRQGTPQLS